MIAKAVDPSLLVLWVDIVFCSDIHNFYIDYCIMMLTILTESAFFEDALSLLRRKQDTIPLKPELLAWFKFLKYKLSKLYHKS